MEIKLDEDNIWTSIKKEINPKKNRLNRINRLRFLNNELFEDDTLRNPHIKWCQEVTFNPNLLVPVLCICGQLLEKEVYIIQREEHKCYIGSGCITYFDEEHDTQCYKEIRDKLKLCSCGNKKKINNVLCKECEKICEKCNYKKYKIDEECKGCIKINQIQVKRDKIQKFINLYPSSDFYKSILNFLNTRGYITEKQEACINKTLQN